MKIEKETKVSKIVLENDEDIRIFKRGLRGIIFLNYPENEDYEKAKQILKELGGLEHDLE